MTAPISGTPEEKPSVVKIVRRIKAKDDNGFKFRISVACLVLLLVLVLTPLYIVLNRIEGKQIFLKLFL